MGFFRRKASLSDIANQLSNDAWKILIHICEEFKGCSVVDLTMEEVSTVEIEFVHVLFFGITTINFYNFDNVAKFIALFFDALLPDSAPNVEFWNKYQKYEKEWIKLQSADLGDLSKNFAQLIINNAFPKRHQTNAQLKLVVATIFAHWVASVRNKLRKANLAP